MKIYAVLLAACSMSMAMTIVSDDIMPPSAKQHRPVPKKLKRLKRAIPGLPIAGNALGKVGEIITTVGGGFLGAKEGMFQGAHAGHAINRDGWMRPIQYEPVYNGFQSWLPRPVYGPGYIQGFGNGFYVPNNGNFQSRPFNGISYGDMTEGSGNGCRIFNGQEYC